MNNLMRDLFEGTGKITLISAGVFLTALLLSTCSGGTPAYAKVLSTNYHGECLMINAEESNKYRHDHPENTKKQTGYLPEDFSGYTGDISGCLPSLTVMGPK